MGDTMSQNVAPVALQEPRATAPRELAEACRSIVREAVAFGILLVAPSAYTQVYRKDPLLRQDGIESKCNIYLTPRQINPPYEARGDSPIAQSRPDLYFSIRYLGKHYCGLLRYDGQDTKLMQYPKSSRRITSKISDLPHALRFEEIDKNPTGKAIVTVELAEWFAKNTKDNMLNPASPCLYGQNVDAATIYVDAAAIFCETPARQASVASA